MIATSDSARHEEAWLALPWLANGRLSPAERDRIEPHVRECTACREEFAFQRMLCNVLTEPDRVTYAPGPSFRKLMERIDGTAPSARQTRERASALAASVDRPRGSSPADPWASPSPLGIPSPPLEVPSLAARSEDRWARPTRNGSAWRPPGLAWAASFILMVGLTGIVTSMYRSSQPLYTTHTAVTPAASDVVHIAFDRSVTIGEAEEVLRAAGARIVEGPDSTGIFGVTPSTSREIRVLSARLRADPRIRWVEPVPGDKHSHDDAEITSRGP